MTVEDSGQRNHMITAKHRRALLFQSEDTLLLEKGTHDAAKAMTLYSIHIHHQKNGSATIQVLLMQTLTITATLKRGKKKRRSRWST